MAASVPSRASLTIFGPDGYQAGFTVFNLMSCSLIGKTPFFGSGLYQFESGQLSLLIFSLLRYFKNIKRSKVLASSFANR